MKVGDNFEDTTQTLREDTIDLTLSKLNDSTIVAQNDCSKLLLKKVLTQKERKVRR
jgi:hypothetical protein